MIEVKVSFDEVITVEEVASAVERYHPVAISFVQAEVVTGGSNPAKEIFGLARQHNLLTVTDSVSAVGGEALLVDEWSVDFAVMGAQKRSPDLTVSAQSAFHHAAGPSWSRMKERLAIPFYPCSI